ncbi:immunity 49 family protein [Endozoicomonadaceae bacterium StTr2]
MYKEDVVLHDVSSHPSSLLEFDISKFEETWPFFLNNCGESGPCGPGHLKAGSADNAFQSAVKLGKPRHECLRFLSIGLETRVATFRLCMSPGEWVEYEVDGKQYRKKGESTSSYVDVGVWLAAYYSALILRSNKAIHDLVRVPEGIVENSDWGVDAFSLANFCLFKGLFDSSANLQQLSEDLTGAVQPEEVTLEREGIVFDILVPTALMIGHIFGGSEEKYQQALSKAVELHRKYYTSSQNHISSPGGWLSLRLTAMAALAYEHKGYLPSYTHDFERDYVPEWLVRGEFVLPV